MTVCDCQCHDWFDPDGLLCIDGYCDVCGELGGGDDSMPVYPGFDCDNHPTSEETGTA